MSKIDYQALREAAQNAKDLGGIKNYKRGEQAVAEFESLITPHIVLALLDERERNQQYIKRRDQENEDIALTVGKLRVELEAAKKRIAELEAEPVSQTYKLNQLPGNSPVTPDGWVMVPKQVTPEISNAINVVGQRCTCGNCSQRLWDLLLDATQQGVNRG
ncbi:TPA: ead/Ea22-like family protein [Escherichia coli]